ncbi:hypothetical protein JCM24511_09324 [Saitozyma sp. JCM 24511]|nr:hypothetical protein JCM24511_09324 [Saitozyma sp. JCM 24511]
MTASHSGAYEVCVEMVPIGGEHSACAATYLDTGNVTVARMTLYDSEANYLAGGANYTTEETCFAGCNALNVNNTITCTGIFWFQDALVDHCGEQCIWRGWGKTWQRDWIAQTPGAEMILLGTCNDWATNVPSDMLATCCENPA